MNTQQRQEKEDEYLEDINKLPHLHIDLLNYILEAYAYDDSDSTLFETKYQWGITHLVSTLAFPYRDERILKTIILKNIINGKYIKCKHKGKKALNKSYNYSVADNDCTYTSVKTDYSHYLTVATDLNGRYQMILPHSEKKQYLALIESTVQSLFQYINHTHDQYGDYTQLKVVVYNFFRSPGRNNIQLVQDNYPEYLI